MTELSLETAISLGGTLIAIVGLLIERFHYDAGMQERIKGLETNMDNTIKTIDELSNVKTDVAEIKTKVSLFWGALETQLPGMLLKGNPLSPDSQAAKLLAKYEAGNITVEECAELVDLLDKEVKTGNHVPGEVLAMVLMNATIKSNLEVRKDGRCGCKS